MLKRKMKKFSGEDGESEVIDMRDNKKNDVGDAARSRAMRFLETGKKDDEKPRASVKKTVKSVVSTPKDYSDQSDRRLNQMAADDMPAKKEPALSVGDMKKSIGFDPKNAGEITPGGAALKGLQTAGANLIKKNASKKAADEAMSGGFSYADKMARESKAPPDLVDKISKAGKKIKDYASDTYKKTTNPKGVKEAKAYDEAAMGSFKKGGSVKSSSASSRADGCAQRGKTKGTMIMCGGGYTGKKK